MTEAGAKRINDAIKDCLRACYDAGSPLAALAATLATLHESEAWNDADIELVEIGAHRMLKLMVRRASSGEFEPLVTDDEATRATAIAEADPANPRRRPR